MPRSAWLTISSCAQWPAISLNGRSPAARAVAPSPSTSPIASTIASVLRDNYITSFLLFRVPAYNKERCRTPFPPCLLYTSDAADDLLCVDLGGRRIIKKKKIIYNKQ